MKNGDIMFHSFVSGDIAEYINRDAVDAQRLHEVLNQHEGRSVVTIQTRKHLKTNDEGIFVTEFTITFGD